MAAPARVSRPEPGRVVSLDAFRGAVIALMVLVNDPGDGHHVYTQLEHAAWNGWTATDVVFPSFLWIAGMALTLSLSKRLQAGISSGALLRQAARRAAILFALGLMVYAAPDFSLATQRVLGVLQRIAICYLAAVAIYITTGIRWQIVWIAGLLIAYWLLMGLIPVPGYGAGRLDVDGNFAHYVDRMVLGAHNYHSTKTWDPEGIVSTLPALATTLFGVLAGHLLRARRALEKRAMLMLLAGAVLLAAGLVSNAWLPINKKLWTTSFALFMAGLDFVLFACFLWLIDGRGYKKAVTPLVIMGLNPIMIYMIAGLLDQVLAMSGWRHAIYRAVFTPASSLLNASPESVSLLWALAYTGLMFGVAWIMYRRGWVVRV
jgi:predicted acyltransferase